MNAVSITRSLDYGSYTTFLQVRFVLGATSNRRFYGAAGAPKVLQKPGLPESDAPVGTRWRCS